jgi:biotin transport system substrate-specific component
MPIRNMVLTGLFAALLSISSQIYIPIGPVPHTLQLIFVLLAGIMLGSRWGSASVAVWISLGVFGLPVFAQGKAGAAVLFGPTGGFLVGFMICAWLVGRLTEGKQIRYIRTLFIMLGSLALVYLIGLAGLMASFTYFLHKPMTWEKAAALSVLPFMPFDIVKAVCAAYLGVRIRNVLDRAGLRIGQ